MVRDAGITVHVRENGTQRDGHEYRQKKTRPVRQRKRDYTDDTQDAQRDSE
jgi:hypothetical protein